MYRDFQNINRDNWHYNYLGKALLAAAKTKLDRWIKEEIAGRKQMAGFMEDRSISMSDQRVKDLEKKITHAADQAEQCLVFVHEFTRNSEKEFSLSLGDVVYFDLAGTNK